jgi:hypothetical protein
VGRGLPPPRRCARQQVGNALFVNVIICLWHESVSLEQHWQMMGALEALNGMLLFGLTTAFLFATIQEVWQIHRRL